MSIPVAFACIALALTAAIEALLLAALLGCSHANGLLP